MVSTPVSLLSGGYDTTGEAESDVFTSDAITAPGDNTLVLIVAHALRGGTVETPVVTAGGKTFTLVHREECDLTSFESAVFIWRMTGTSWTTTGMSFDFVSTHFGLQAFIYEVEGTVVTGTAAADAIVQVVGARQTGLAEATSLGPTLASFSDVDNTTFFAFGTNANDSTDPNSIDSPLTELDELGSTTLFRTLTIGYYAGNETTPSGQQNSGSTFDTATIGVELNDSGGGGAPATRRYSLSLTGIG